MTARMRPIRILSALLVLGAGLLLANCPNPILDQIAQRTAAAKSGVSPFASFTFTSALNSASGVSLDSVGTITGADVAVTVPYGTKLTALIATFATSGQGTVTVGSTTQASASTPNDFTNPVAYTLTAPDGTTYTGTVTVKIGPAGVIMSQSTLNLAAGGQPTPLLYTISPPDPSATFTWTVSDPTVLKLTYVGLVTAFDGAGLVWEELVTPLAAGTATITLKTADGSKSATCTVTVTPPVYVTSVTLNTTSMTMAVGGSPIYLQATVSPANATNQFVTWTSSSPTVATVDSGGNVSAVGIGYSIITATTFDGNKTATCLVTVVAATPVASVSVAPATMSIAMGGYGPQVNATISPANATNQHITWSTSDATVATVTNYGGTYAYITPVAVGIATITATTQDGGKTATCAVTITAPVAVTGVSMSQPTITATVGDSGWPFFLYAYITPTNATNWNMTWSTSNASVVDFEYSGTNTGYYGYASLKAVGAGTATITATTADGNKTTTCAVTVNPAIAVYSVTLTPVTVDINDSGIMPLSIQPANATNKSMTWTSNNTGVATVSSNGTVLGVAAGTATITATATDGSGKFGSAVVTVAKVTGITLQAGFSLAKGTGTTLSAPTFTPSYSLGFTPNVTWSSSNSSIVSVTMLNGNPYVFAYGNSTQSATITATATDGASPATGSVIITIP